MGIYPPDEALCSGSSVLKCTIHRWACPSTLRMPFRVNALQILWISCFHWHDMAMRFSGYPGTKSGSLSLDLQPKCQGAGRRVCLATQHGSFLLPFQEANVTFAVPYTREVCHPSLVNQYMSPHSQGVKDNCQKLAIYSKGMGQKVPAFPMLHTSCKYLPRATG